MIILKGYGGSYIVTEGYGWSEAVASSGVLTGIQRFVHSTFIPRAVRDAQVSKGVLSDFTPCVVAWSGGYKALHHSGAFKVIAMDYRAAQFIHDDMASKAVVPSVEVKAVREERIAKVYHARSTTANVVRSGGQGKMVK